MISMPSWSMRSWDSEPRPTSFGGRAESQDRMDQETSALIAYKS